MTEAAAWLERDVGQGGTGGGKPATYGMAVRNAESKTRCTHLREKILAVTGG
ncbi:MAG: hypothetical protein PSU94_17805 [Lacunisphaera sp.]|nr:hypothetical protein [Lacunisphaera sp.]